MATKAKEVTYEGLVAEINDQSVVVGAGRAGQILKLVVLLILISATGTNAIKCWHDGIYAQMIVMGALCTGGCLAAVKVLNDMVSARPVLAISESVDSDFDSSQRPLVSISASEIRSLQVRYVYSKDNIHSGFFEIGARLHDRKSLVVIAQSRLYRSRRLLSQALQLSNRWNLPLDVKSRSIECALLVKRGWMNYLFLVLGLCAIAGSVYIGARQMLILRWPKTNALVKEFSRDEFGGAGALKWYANPKVKYDYVVAGQCYSGEGWSASPFNYQSRTAFLRDSKGIAPGERVQCWYNPRDHAEAYLVNRGLRADPVVLFVTAIFFLFLFVSTVREAKFLENWLRTHTR